MADLSSQFLSYLDPHLALLLIDFVKSKNVHTQTNKQINKIHTHTLTHIHQI